MPLSLPFGGIKDDMGYKLTHRTVQGVDLVVMAKGTTIFVDVGELVHDIASIILMLPLAYTGVYY